MTLHLFNVKHRLAEEQEAHEKQKKKMNKYM